MNETNEKTMSRYDDLPYESYAYMHSAPEQLASVATLFGLPSPDVANARVLELGCASGSNLIPFALRNPGAEVVGVDISRVHVADGCALVARLGASNVKLLEADLAEMDPESLGQFDYIVAHGVYSWVSPEVQEAVLKIIGRCLAPDGVAFVSYNTYPGWKTKEIVRDAMLLHGGARTDAKEQVAYGRSMLAFLQNVAVKGGLMAATLNENLAQVMNSPASYVAHDYLEPFNLPCYFHQFTERAGGHGLAYLGEAQPSMMMPANYGPELAEQLYGALGEDQLRVEQYLDFAIGRGFRQTLLVGADRGASLRWLLARETLHGMHFAAPMACVDGDIKLDGQPQNFAAPPNTASIIVGLSALKQAIGLLGRSWPGTVTRDELVRHAELTQGHGDAVSAEILGQAVDELLEALVMRGMARIRLDPVAAAAVGSEQVRVDPVVERQVAALAPGQKHVVNAWHDTVEIGGVERFLIPLLDGNRSRADLVLAVTEALREGKSGLSEEVATAVPEARAEGLVDAALKRMCEAALLLRKG